MGADEQQLAVLRQLRALLAYPRESLDVELKGWLDLTDGEHQADLMKASLALANHGGGFVLIGYLEEEGTWMPDEQCRPPTLAGYDQDRLNGLVTNYAEPSFHCELHQVSHPETAAIHPVIRIPGGTVPIRARRSGPNDRHVRINTYYVRRPGPSSDSPRSGREWDELLDRCIRVHREQLLDDLRRILEGPGLAATAAQPTAHERLEEWAAESRARWGALVAAHGETHPREQAAGLYEHGTFELAYILEGDLRRPTQPELLAVLERCQGRETGWPEWLVLSRPDLVPRPVEGGMIETFLIDSMFGDPAHADYWRASPDGRFYLLRGYEEDSAPANWTPGTVFDLTLPIWRTGEALLHAERVARELGDEDSLVHFRASWSGLQGRIIRALWTRRILFERTSKIDTVTSYVHVQAAEIATALPEIVHKLLAPLYAAFDFLEMGLPAIEEELNDMRRAP